MVVEGEERRGGGEMVWRRPVFITVRKNTSHTSTVLYSHGMPSMCLMLECTKA